MTSITLNCSGHLSDDIFSLFSFNSSSLPLKSIAADIGFSIDRIATPEQIHSLEVTSIDFPGVYQGVDGLITDNSEVILTLKVADCVPVFMYASQSNIIGLVHSGWRGTVGGIIMNAVQLMQKMGANERDIKVFLGPAIGICCYEVDGEVADMFDKEAKVKLDNIKWKVGLHEQIRIQLIESGISHYNILTSDICTFESQNCHSYRRDGSKTGRMFSFMSLKS